MTKITNQQVFDALTSGITQRWNLHAAETDGYSTIVVGCALCEVFYGGCLGCPLLLRTGMTCGDGGSLYLRWSGAYDGPRKQILAQQMLDLLTDIRKEHFGDWLEEGKMK